MCFEVLCAGAAGVGANLGDDIPKQLSLSYTNAGDLLRNTLSQVPPQLLPPSLCLMFMRLQKH
jgi:hypothetical protein